MMYCESVVRMLFSVEHNRFLFDLQGDNDYFVDKMLHLHHFDWGNGFDDYYEYSIDLLPYIQHQCQAFGS
jgi:hypothetical protein